MLVSLMGAKSDAMKFRAAKAILDFVMGPPTENGLGGRNTDDDYKQDYDRINEILESAKKKQQNQAVGN